MVHGRHAFLEYEPSDVYALVAGQGLPVFRLPARLTETMLASRDETRMISVGPAGFQLVKPEDRFPYVETPDEGALALGGADEPLFCQNVDGPADGHGAHVELLTELCLPWAIDHQGEDHLRRSFDSRYALSVHMPVHMTSYRWHYVCSKKGPSTFFYLIHPIYLIIEFFC